MPTRDLDLAELVSWLAAARVLPVLRLPTADGAVEAVDACVDAGSPVAELTATTQHWQEALHRVRSRHPRLVLGLGTVTTYEEASAALTHGADFLVSPFPVADVRERVPPRTLLIEGGMTVREIVVAARHGIAKLFPAHLGGAAFLQSVLSVAPWARVVPTGGVRIDEVESWLSAGALAVGVGTDLLTQPDLAEALASLRTRSLQG